MIIFYSTSGVKILFFVNCTAQIFVPTMEQMEMCIKSDELICIRKITHFVTDKNSTFVNDSSILKETSKEFTFIGIC